jgi:8-oxo-dGTP pyrophosphatase MutT (NUDIX family)
MDSFLDLLPALIFFWVIARALRGGRRRGRQQPQSTPPAAAAQGRPASGIGGFEELVRRLEAAAREAQEETRATVAPPALPQPARAADYRSRTGPPVPEFAFVGAIDEPLQEAEFHETHPLSRGQRPSSAMPSADMPSEHLGERPGPVSLPLHPLAKRLRTVATAREAILLKDVLGPPRSRR